MIHRVTKQVLSSWSAGIAHPGSTSRAIPGVEAGIADHVWSIEEIVNLTDK